VGKKLVYHCKTTTTQWYLY